MDVGSLTAKRGAGKTFFPLVRIALAMLLGASVIGCGQPTQFAASDGSALALDGSNQDWIVVNYWAEWCAPCREEIPVFNALHASGQVRVLGVNFDVGQGQAQAEARLVVARMGIQFPQLAVDPGPGLGWTPLAGLPATVVIQPGHGVLTVRYGPQTEADIRSIVNDAAKPSL